MASKEISSLSSFAHLPPEIREQIWLYALNEQLTPAVFFYKPGCWERDDENSTKKTVKVNFRHRWLTPIRVKLPLACVDRDTRGTALFWAGKHNILLLYSEERQHYVWARHFEPSCDILYVADRVLQLFKDDYQHKTGLKQRVSSHSEVISIAVSQRVFEVDLDLLRPIFKQHDWVERIYVIKGAGIHSDVSFGDRPWHSWWELLKTLESSLRWDYDSMAFHVKHTTHAEDWICTKNVSEEAEKLERTEFYMMDGLKIRPVVAVKKWKPPNRFFQGSSEVGPAADPVKSPRYCSHNTPLIS